MRSSPTAAAARSPWSTSPGSSRPRAREAVRLQLHPDGERVARARVALLRGVHALRDAEDVLDVVPDLVRDDVRVRELASRAEARRELPVEAQVDIDLLVERAVER